MLGTGEKRRIALIYVLADHEEAMVAHIVWKICNKIKQQPWIVAVYWSLERKCIVIVENIYNVRVKR